MSEEPSVQDKGENLDGISKSKMKRNHSVPEVKGATFRPSKLEKAKEGTHQFDAEIQKRKRESFPLKVWTHLIK